MSNRKYYVLCDSNCKFESLTKEQILTAIEQAVSTGEIQNVDSGFVTTLKEANKNTGLKFWVGTNAEYNALDPKPADTFCIITDDSLREDLQAAIGELIEKYGSLDSRLNVLSTAHTNDINALIETVNTRVMELSAMITNVSNRVPAKLNKNLTLPNGEIYTNAAVNETISGISSYHLLGVYLRNTANDVETFVLVYGSASKSGNGSFIGDGELSIYGVTPSPVHLQLACNKETITMATANSAGITSYDYQMLITKIVGIC